MNDTVYGVSPGLAVHEMHTAGCRRPRCTVCKFIGNIYLVGEHSVLPRYG